jgi:hypothetical protein
MQSRRIGLGHTSNSTAQEGRGDERLEAAARYQFLSVRRTSTREMRREWWISKLETDTFYGSQAQEKIDVVVCRPLSSSRE